MERDEFIAAVNEKVPGQSTQRDTYLGMLHDRVTGRTKALRLFELGELMMLSELTGIDPITQ